MVCKYNSGVIFATVYKNLKSNHGGRDGIRTHGAVAHTHAFQACSLSHSDTLPPLIIASYFIN